MNLFSNMPVVWFIAGFIFFLLEFILPGFVIFFFGTGAWIVAIATLFLDISINTQLVLFIASSMLSLALFRKTLRKKINFTPSSNELEDEFIGRPAKAESSFGPGVQGKVHFRGTQWMAQSEDKIEAGESVTIIGNDSITLIVKSEKK